MRRSVLQHEISKRKPFDSPSVEVFLNLQRTAAALHNQSERLMKSHGISGSQYNALRILRGARQGGDSALPCLEVSQRMITPVPDITRLMNRLESAGLIERERAGADRRVVFVTITRLGLQTLKKLDEPLRILHLSQFQHMSRSEISTLNELLVKARRQDVEG